MADPFVIDSRLTTALRAAKRVTVLTGAGVSAESGIPTFRDKQTGLWENFDAAELATPYAFERDPSLVWGWYECNAMCSFAWERHPWCSRRPSHSTNCPGRSSRRRAESGGVVVVSLLRGLRHEMLTRYALRQRMRNVQRNIYGGAIIWPRCKSSNFRNTIRSLRAFQKNAPFVQKVKDLPRTTDVDSGHLLQLGT